MTRSLRNALLVIAARSSPVPRRCSAGPARRGQLRRERLQPLDIARAVGADQHLPRGLHDRQPLRRARDRTRSTAASKASLYAEDILELAAQTSPTARAPAGRSPRRPERRSPRSATTARLPRTTIAISLPASISAGGAALEECRIEMPFGSPSICSMPNNQAPRRVHGPQHDQPVLRRPLRHRHARAHRLQRRRRAAPHRASVHVLRGGDAVRELGCRPLTQRRRRALGRRRRLRRRAVTFTASDATGIQQQVVQRQPGRTLIAVRHGLRLHAAAQPCPQQPSATLNVDTTRVADGPRTFGSSSPTPPATARPSTSPPVVVDNHGPPPPAGLSATVKPGSRTVALAWRTRPARPRRSSGAMAQLCSTSCTTAVPVDAFGAAQLTAPGPGLYSVRLWLLDSGRARWPAQRRVCGRHRAVIERTAAPSSCAARQQDDASARSSTAGGCASAARSPPPAASRSAGARRSAGAPSATDRGPSRRASTACA